MAKCQPTAGWLSPHTSTTGSPVAGPEHVVGDGHTGKFDFWHRRIIAHPAPSCRAGDGGPDLGLAVGRRSEPVAHDLSPCAARWRRRTRRGLPPWHTPTTRPIISSVEMSRADALRLATARCRRRSMLCFISSTIPAQFDLMSMPAELRASKRSCLADACWANSPRNENSASPGSSAPACGLGHLEEVLEAGHHDRLEQRLFGGEVAVQGPDAHPGPFGHGVDGDRQALGGEDRLGRLEDALAVLDGIGPHGSWPTRRRVRGESSPISAASGLGARRGLCIGGHDVGPPTSG